jgi:predicted  nucleic acid-binding Zn-ribbon protein
MAPLDPKEFRSDTHTDEMQKAQSEIAGLRKALELKHQELEQSQSKAQKDEESFQIQRRRWQYEVAEKQLLLQGREAEIEQSKAEIASLRKRVRELESAGKQPEGPEAGPKQSVFPTRQHLDTLSATGSFESNKKSSRIFGARRWRTGEQKRRWQS